MKEYIKNIEEQIEFYKKILENIDKESQPIDYTLIEEIMRDLESELIMFKYTKM